MGWSKSVWIIIMAPTSFEPATTDGTHITPSGYFTMPKDQRFRNFAKLPITHNAKITVAMIDMHPRLPNNIAPASGAGPTFQAEMINP
jgi:hypothetical protein